MTNFIEIYKEHLALWQIKSRQYLNKNFKKIEYLALIEVYKKYNLKADKEIVKKIQNTYDK